MHAAFEQMVPAVLMDAGGSVADSEQLRTAFLALFGVQVEHRELDTWLENLAVKGTLTRSGTAIVLAAATRDSLEARREEFEELAKGAEQDWRAAMIQEEPSISADELDSLWAEIEDLIGRMVAYHGAEAAVILYPKEPRSKALLETLEKQGPEPRQANPERRAMSRKSVANFFLSPSPAQRRYLADRLDHGFFATVGTVRPSAGTTMRNEMAGHRLYLDTNVLIPCLGLAGSRHEAAAKRLLELTRDLGVELAVTTKTLEEFRHSLKSTRDDLERDPPSRRYASVMREQASGTGGSSLAEGYWEALERNGSTIRDWFLKAQVVEPSLERLGIEVVDDEVEVVLNRETKRVDAYLELLGREAARRGRSREDHQLRHDALHRVLVERLREDGAGSFRNARHWFVTEDKLLPEFGHVPLPGEPRPQIPFCISAAAWAQIARCFTPRTDDYDRMVTDLLASPYLSFGSLDLGEIQYVISRIATLKENASPAVLAAVLNEEVLKAVAGTKEQSDKDEILREAYEREEDKIEAQRTELRERLREMEAELEVNRSEAGTVSRLRTEMEAKQAEHDDEVDRLQRDNRLALDENDELKAKLAAAEAEAEQRRRARLRTAWVVAGCLALTALLALTATEVVSVDLLVIGAAAVAAATVAPFIEHTRFAWSLAFVLAVAGIAIEVVS
jgi:predicted nucleic acid-binding protein